MPTNEALLPRRRPVQDRHNHGMEGPTRMSPLAMTLREYADQPQVSQKANELLHQAADEIDKLTGANSSLVNIICDVSAHYKTENDRLREIEAMYEGLCK